MSIQAVTAGLPLAATLAGQGVSALVGGVKASTEKIRSVAEDFEAMFTGDMLKQMRQTLESDGLFGKDGGDVYGGLFDFFMGKHIAQSGGLGLQPMIVKQFSQPSQPPTSG